MFGERRPIAALSCATLSCALLLVAGRAGAQACCAASTALTPGRLAVHEDALLGMQLRANDVIGSYDVDGRYAASPPRTSEVDFEEDLFATVRVAGRGQAAVLFPIVQQLRTAREVHDGGGGVGDVNVSGRWDFTLAGESFTLPGIAALIGATLPTGTPPERATHRLATDATGVGAVQVHVGLALEQTFGNVQLNVTALVAKRASRSVSGVHETLGTQGTFLAAVGYAFDNDAALALVGSYTLEANATIEGAEASGSGRRFVTLALAAAWPFNDALRVQGSLFGNPPISQLGANQPAGVGLTLSVVRAWS